MKATDLMVGDWVICNYYSDKPCYMQFGVGDFQKLGFEFCDPIPLTHEILEKNRFVLKEKEKGAYGVNIAPYYTRNDVPFEVFCDGEPFAIWFKDPVNIAFVHQLQHALRLCEIEKEIVL